MLRDAAHADGASAEKLKFVSLFTSSLGNDDSSPTRNLPVRGHHLYYGDRKL